MRNPRLSKAISDYFNSPFTLKRALSMGAGILFTLKLDDWLEESRSVDAHSESRGKTKAQNVKSGGGDAS